jgi:hypothetical protein
MYIFGLDISYYTLHKLSLTVRHYKTVMYVLRHSTKVNRLYFQYITGVHTRGEIRE